ncbi:hypothetical protein BBK82_43630 [Lentzea guizhouensis]|uniref:DUF3558 domain-containing protein n=1 Tax=Lentzea guizhouensis TaxID=1586287 RepID=A0A1B2HVV4_9PSEU|nr:DUF3558 family protein [Lentzea guizhouensis]ANZ41812.1 hypothetical protein BBK82_43630 [Lentzea guizhouensis]
MTSRTILTAVAAAGLLFIAACGETTGGDARPATDSSEATSSTSTAPTTSSGAGTGSLEDVDPCSLLATEDAADLGATKPPKREMVGSADSCAWKPGNANLSVGVRTNLGLAQAQPNGGQITDITVGDRPAKQISGTTTGGCVVVLGVTSSSRVDVTVIPAPNSDGCPMALKVAGLVESKLP